MVALRKPRPIGMTVAEFQTWEPISGKEYRWQLVDGEPVCMAPASENHGAIQSEAAILIGLHLRSHRPRCRVIITPGVVPRIGAENNHRIPDLGVTCTPPVGANIVTNPVLLVEILSPSNTALTRANIWAYTTIPSVLDILLLSSFAVEAELLTRNPGEAWPPSPRRLGTDDTLELPSIGLCAHLRDFYRTTSLLAPDAPDAQDAPE